MNKLILVSHGHFCTELKKSAEMVFGPLDYIYTVELLANEGPSDFKKKFNETTANLDNFTVFADLLGGTPCNQVVQVLMENDNDFELYAGMNFSMIISFVNAQLVGKQASIIDDARKGIVKVNDVLSSEEDESL